MRGGGRGFIRGDDDVYQVEGRIQGRAKVQRLEGVRVRFRV